MSQTKRKIDSNSTGLAFARESSLKSLPAGGYPASVLGAMNANANCDDIQLTWDDETKQLVITGNIISFTDTITCRITRTRGGFPTVDVGVQVSIGGPSGWDTSDPVGGIGQWDVSMILLPLAPSLLTVVADLTGLVQDGDILKIEFDTDLAFVGSADRSLTLTTIGTGNAIWYELEPNEYDDFGAEIELVARAPIANDRQKKKGNVTDVESDGGFNSDLTQTNLQRLLQGFVFADAHERPTTDSILENNNVVVSALTADPYITVDDSGVFLIGQILKLSGFATVGNNGLAVIIDIPDGTSLEVDLALTAEPAPPAGAKVEVVGFQTTADANHLELNGGVLHMDNATDDFTTMGFVVGEWLFVGGDANAHRYTNNFPGFVRIKSISANRLVLDELSWPDVVDEDAAGGKTIRLFFGTVIKNEDDPSLIKCQSYQLERQLGSDIVGPQSEYLVGAVPNELTINAATKSLITADLSFVAMDTEYRNGADGLKPGTRVDAPAEDGFNTSSNVYQMRLYVHNTLNATPGSLFGFAEEVKFSINNNVSGLKAIANVGSFDINVGDFEVSGEVNVYFATVEAIKALRANADVGFNIIAALDNAGFVFDIPLLSLGGGRTAVKKDEPIMLPLEKMGAKCEAGYTMLSTWFAYLPTVAMDN